MSNPLLNESNQFGSGNDESNSISPSIQILIKRKGKRAEDFKNMNKKEKPED